MMASMSVSPRPNASRLACISLRFIYVQVVVPLAEVLTTDWMLLLLNNATAVDIVIEPFVSCYVKNRPRWTACSHNRNAQPHNSWARGKHLLQSNDRVGIPPLC